jgi:hypothetical protein
MTGRAHFCAAIGCPIRTPGEMLMCRIHWARVPKATQIQVWETYRIGIRNGAHPSRAWCEAADHAVAIIAEREGRKVDPLKTYFRTYHPNTGHR